MRYDQEPGRECSDCPEGAICNGGLELPHSREGWWAAKDMHHSFLKCEMEFKSVKGNEERRGNACIGSSACADIATADGTALVSGRACNVCAGRVYQDTCVDCRLGIDTLGGANSKVLQAVIAFVTVVGWYTKCRHECAAVLAI